MPRTVQDAKLDTRSHRKTLPVRREPHWRSISPGLAIGYRRLAMGGTWIARHYAVDEGRRYLALGAADDVADADGVHVLSFSEAQAKAREWFQKLASGEGRTGPYTVNQAMDDYLADYTRRGGRVRRRLEWTIDANIRPTLGKVQVAKLTRQKIDQWHNAIASTGARVRTGRDQEQRFSAVNDEDTSRRRRVTANHVLAILRAALNLAHKNGRADNAEAWRQARPFRAVDVAKVRYLSDDETRRLVEACDAEFRQIVTAALLTGARYGELAAARVVDFSPDTGTLYISRSKSGKARHIHLTDEGIRHLAAVTEGKSSAALLFTHAGQAWGHGHQTMRMRDACKVAGIAPAIGFHILRHTYASRLAMKAVSMSVIAAQLGHSSTKITERHYAHLAPSYVGDTVRAAFTEIGIVA